MEKYIKSITALNDLALQLKSSNQNELDRFAESDIFWSVNKSKPSSRNVSKGTIYQFEFTLIYLILQTLTNHFQFKYIIHIYMKWLL